MTAPQPTIEIVSAHQDDRMNPVDFQRITALRDRLPNIVPNSTTTYPSVFALATCGGKFLGAMGLADPDYRISEYATTVNPAEIECAFVIPDARQAGVGRLLLNKLENVALELDCTELLVQNGTKNEPSGQAFWNSVFGRPIATAEDYYGCSFDVQIWQKTLYRGTVE